VVRDPAAGGALGEETRMSDDPEALLRLAEEDAFQRRCATATFWRVVALVAWGFALTVLGLLAGMLIGGQR
jgi:hypothetical protein